MRPNAVRRWLVPVLLALVASAPGCREEKSGSGAASPSARRYTVRAEVVKLPEAGAPRRQLSLRHEAIPDFANESGAVVGMASMVMSFDLSPAVAADGLRVGDKVEARFAMDWARPSLQIEQLRKLPDDTVLETGKGRPRP